MKKYVLVSVLDSFEFPIREATRKQIWWKALEKKEEGYNVSILILTNKRKIIKREGITIKFINRWKWFPLLSADFVHVITGSVTIWLLAGFFWVGKKNLTLTDGDMFGYKNKNLRRFVIHFLPLIFDKIVVYSEYQKRRLKLKKVFIEKPILPPIVINKNIKRSKHPSLLYMGHLSYFKGVDLILRVFKELISEFPDLVLIIANNSIRGDIELINEVNDLKVRYNKNIMIKGVVDPIEELSKAWVYLYPFREAIGTMAYPLSLYEAQQCNTPFIACDVGANSEFFDRKFLIMPNDSIDMINKIEYFIRERYRTENI